jgi:hypothetical protein
MTRFLSSSCSQRIAVASLFSLSLILSGCGAGSISLSGPDTTPTAVHVNLKGTVYGGQQPVSYSAIQLWSVGSGSYGASATELTAARTTTTSEYYPGGTRGCDSTSLTITNYTTTGSTATFSASNTMMVGELVQINDTASALSGQTLPVTASSAVSFTVADTTDAATAGADSGSAVPICYINPRTDINGNFSIVGDYTAPGTAVLTYITATGGNPGLSTASTNNTAIVMVAPLGLSSGLGSLPAIVINEVTTTGMAFAAGQYFGMSNADSFGTSSTTQGQLGLTNAFATYKNLVSPTSGGPQGVQTLTTSGVGSITVTPETAKVGTIADILAACVNTGSSGSTPCTELFADTPPTGGTAPTNTLEAAVYMSLNPTSTNANSSSANITQLFGLISATPPYPGYTAPYTDGTQPTDWTIGVTYGSSSTNASGVYLMNYPTYVAINASGDVWMVNDASTSVTSTANSVTEIGPAGSPLAQGLTGAGVLAGPAGIAIDLSGNVYIPNYGSTSALQTNVAEYTSGGVANSFTVNKGPQRITIDGKSNVFVLEPSYKGLGDLEEITAGSATGTSATTLATGLTTDFSNLTIDSNYTLWVTGGGTGASGGTTGYPYVYQFLNNSGSYPTTPSATTNAGGIATPEQAISVGKSNQVYVQNYGAETVSVISGTSTISAASGSAFTGPANLTKPEFQVTDGAGNLWVTDAASTSATPAGSVYEMSAAGANLSPSVGFAHTYNEPYGIAVDPSGNVWVGAYSAAEPSGFITEIVGAAAPTISPIAAQLPSTAGGTSLIATKP